MQDRICILPLVPNLILHFTELFLKLLGALLSTQELLLYVAFSSLQSFNFLFMAPYLRVKFFNFALHLFELSFSEGVLISVGLEFASNITELFLLTSHLLVKLSF